LSVRLATNNIVSSRSAGVTDHLPVTDGLIARGAEEDGDQEEAEDKKEEGETL